MKKIKKKTNRIYVIKMLYDSGNKKGGSILSRHSSYALAEKAAKKNSYVKHGFAGISIVDD